MFMKILEGPREIAMAKHYMSLAAEVALKSTCKKSQRGAVIVKEGEVVGEGYNKPTLPDLCCLRADIHDNSHSELCCAIHAEQKAINDTDKHLYQGATMYHAKVKEGKEVPVGDPSCT